MLRPQLRGSALRLLAIIVTHSGSVGRSARLLNGPVLNRIEVQSGFSMSDAFVARTEGSRQYSGQCQHQSSYPSSPVGTHPVHFAILQEQCCPMDNVHTLPHSRQNIASTRQGCNSTGTLVQRRSIDRDQYQHARQGPACDVCLAGKACAHLQARRNASWLPPANWAWGQGKVATPSGLTPGNKELPCL